MVARILFSVKDCRKRMNARGSLNPPSDEPEQALKDRDNSKKEESPARQFLRWRQRAGRAAILWRNLRYVGGRSLSHLATLDGEASGLNSPRGGASASLLNPSHHAMTASGPEMIEAAIVAIRRGRSS